jgi:hypothetical protein
MVGKMGGFGLFGVVFKGRLNRNNHQKPTFYPLGDLIKKLYHNIKPQQFQTTI